MTDVDLLYEALLRAEENLESNAKAPELSRASETINAAFMVVRAVRMELLRARKEPTQ